MISKTKSDMDIALCISGQMRTYKKCFGDLKSNIIEPLNPDIFVHTWREKGTTTKLDGGEPKKDQVKERDIERLYQPISYTIEDFKQSYFRKKDGVKVPIALQNLPSNHWKGNIPMFYKMHACNSAKKKYENKNDFKYDLVIRLRPDMIIRDEIPQKVFQNPDILWHHHYKIDDSYQISDKFAISNSENMDYYSSVWDSLNDYWERPLGDGQRENYRIGERLMFHHLANSEISTRTFKNDSQILRSKDFLKRKYRTNTEQLIRMIYRKSKQIIK